MEPLMQITPAGSVPLAGGGNNGSVTDAERQLLAGAATANTPNTLVKRDGSGNFSAGTITANLSGNATTATTATTATNATTLAAGADRNALDARNAEAARVGSVVQANLTGGGMTLGGYTNHGDIALTPGVWQVSVTWLFNATLLSSENQVYGEAYNVTDAAVIGQVSTGLIGNGSATRYSGATTLPGVVVVPSGSKTARARAYHQLGTSGAAQVFGGQIRAICVG